MASLFLSFRPTVHFLSFHLPILPLFFYFGACIFSIWNSLLCALHVFLFLTSCSCFTVQGLSVFPWVSASLWLAVCCVSPLRLSGAAAEPCSQALLENRLLLAAGSTEPGGLQGEPLGQSSRFFLLGWSEGIGFVSTRCACQEHKLPPDFPGYCCASGLWLTSPGTCWGALWTLLLFHEASSCPPASQGTRRCQGLSWWGACPRCPHRMCLPSSACQGLQVLHFCCPCHTRFKPLKNPFILFGMGVFQQSRHWSTGLTQGLCCVLPPTHSAPFPT